MLKKYNTLYVNYLTVIFLIFTLSAKAQIEAELMTFEALDTLILETSFEGNQERAFKLSKRQLEIGKKQNDSIKIARSFTHLANIADPDQSIRYSDSILHYTINNVGKIYPALGYIIKSRSLMMLGNYQEALEPLTIGKKLSEDFENTDHQLQVYKQIILLKTLLGDYYEALEISKRYIRTALKTDLNNKENQASLISGYYNLSYCHLNLANIDSARITINKGVSLVNKYSLSNYANEFYQPLIAKIDYLTGEKSSSLAYYERTRGSAKRLHLAENLYFTGKMKMDEGNLEEGLKFLILMDSVISNEKATFDYEKQAYFTISNIYKSLNNPEKQLYYLNEYLRVDSIQIARNDKIAPILVSRYDRQAIINERKKLTEQLIEADNKLLVYGGLIILSLLIIILLVYNRIRLNKKIRKLVSEGLQLNRTSVKEEQKKIEFSKDNNDEISKKLELSLLDFEKGTLFLNKDLTLNKLSKILDTNSSYLSKHINRNKGRNFPSYLRGLRIQYALNEIKTKSNIGRYNNSGLADLFGFQSADTFSLAFYKETGVRPSVFIKRAKKIHDNL